MVTLLMVVAMMGCRPRGVLSNREMREVLYDLHRADGALQVAGYHYSHDQEVAAYYKNILDKHGITQAEFDSSLVWFTDNPQIFNKIYPKVVERLDADFEKQKAIRDANREKKREQDRVKKQQRTTLSQTKKEIAELLERCRNGVDYSIKEWQPEEFSEKNVIIFGQLEKK